jgi:hypothetical protein
MKRVVVILALLSLVLAGCGGSSTVEAIPDPPGATAFERGSNQQLNTIVEQWQAQVPASLTDRQIKQETIEQKVYQSSASLQEVADFYSKTLAEQGWVEVGGMPGIQNGFFTSGYDHGTTHLVIGALDAKQFGQDGVVIYTARGTT